MWMYIPTCVQMSRRRCVESLFLYGVQCTPFCILVGLSVPWTSRLFHLTTSRESISAQSLPTLSLSFSLGSFDSSITCHQLTLSPHHRLGYVDGVHHWTIPSRQRPSEIKSCTKVEQPGQRLGGVFPRSNVLTNGPRARHKECVAVLRYSTTPLKCQQQRSSRNVAIGIIKHTCLLSIIQVHLK